MMRIAFITPVFPYPLDSGMRVRVFHLARHLGQSHRVHLFSLDTGDTEAAATALGLPVTNLAPLVAEGRRVRRGPFMVPEAISDRLWDLIARVEADVVHVEMDYAAALLGLPMWSAPIPIVLDSGCTYHLSYLREVCWARSPVSRLRALVRWFRLRRYEARLAAGVDVVVVVSAKEAAILRRLHPGVHSPVVPNAVDCGAFPCPPLGSEILFCGALTWPPNRDAVLFFLRRILPRIRAAGYQPRVALVGAGTDPAVQRLAGAVGSVLLPGQVPDILTWYARAGVVINPMRGGGGTRFKVLEGMASGRPVVSTRIGAEGIEVTDGREVLLADDPTAFADAVCYVLRNPEAAAAMGQAGRALVERRYDWKTCLAPLDTLYEELPSRHR